MPKLEVDRRAFVAGLIAAGFSARATAAGAATVHLSPGCGCCGKYVEHLRRAGFAVRVEAHDDLAPVKRTAGVPAELEACHTTLVDGYVAEGHVPAAAIRRLLAERPRARGVAVPGMPAGSPGMEGGTPEPYTVFLFDSAGAQEPWMRFVGTKAV